MSMPSVFPPISDSVVARYDVQAPRYTSYPPVPTWHNAVTGERVEEQLRCAGERATQPLSLYVHIPFCRERCTFCGCNVVVSKDRARADRYLDHVARELELYAERLGSRRTLSQIHWGGGTPTFLDEPQIVRLADAITRQFSALYDAEISIEIDPVVTTKRQLSLLSALGFNRLSMGVQDFDPQVQDAIHRPQTVEQTREKVEYARRLGFSSINFDLIYGLPLQTDESWTRTLGQVLSLRPDRLAVYSFAFVPEARPHQKRLAVFPMAQGPSKLELFRRAYETLTAAGYLPIGMDHFALPGDELVRAQERRALTRNF